MTGIPACHAEDPGSVPGRAASGASFFWTSSDYRGLVFGPLLASGRSFLDLLCLLGGLFLDLGWLPGARLWTSSGFGITSMPFSVHEPVVIWPMANI